MRCRCAEFPFKTSEAEETRETTRALGIGVVAYSPLGRGFLTGAIQTLADVDGRRAAHPRFQEANFAANRALVEKIEAIEKGAQQHSQANQTANLGAEMLDNLRFTEQDEESNDVTYSSHPIARLRIGEFQFEQGGHLQQFFA